VIVKLSTSALKDTRWYEYLIRFVLGGAVTAFTGLVSSLFGASVGGLFLALPAIFCASATLIASHEERRKQEAGASGRRRGQQAAALDAAGAALGSLGMLAFALTFWLLVERRSTAAFVVALAAWSVISVAAWWVWRRIRASRRVSGPRGREFAARELT
jgi:Sec-independent protein secretion pathway component TatC